MKSIAAELDRIVSQVEPTLTGLPDPDTARKPSPREWSHREILGHLIDSAANNHQRIVRAATGGEPQPPYHQNDWVEFQRYAESPWPPLVALWAAANRHLVRVIELIPADAGGALCTAGTERPVTLEFAVTDYLRHLKHHLKDILGEEL